MESPFVFARKERTPAPTLGADTRALLEEIGMSEDEISALAERKVIAVV
jgi:crotonobetainyl-CoA:carnitine CoA-transferase CaiB-like acyl-CoA transferase